MCVIYFFQLKIYYWYNLILFIYLNKKKVKFEQVNAHAYSPRPNTASAIWTSQLTEDMKQDRLQRIKRLATEHALFRSNRFLNNIYQVLVEEVNSKDPTQVYGRNPHSRLVFFTGKIQDLRGKIVSVLITEVKAYYLFGKIVE
jgi:tRNA-2-methylthio-N6-dimethylallyladenosine synthase